MNEQLPPCCIEAEEAVLGALLLDPSAIRRVEDVLTKEVFFVRVHGLIYEAISKLNIFGKQADLIGVSTHLHERNLLDQIGGTGKLAALINRTVSTSSLEGHTRIIVEKYKRRQLIAIAYSILDVAQKESDLLSETYERVRQLLPEEVMEAPSNIQEATITEISYTVKSADGLQELELKAETFDDENLFDEVAKLAAKATFYGDRLWREKETDR